MKQGKEKSPRTRRRRVAMDQRRRTTTAILFPSYLPSSSQTFSHYHTHSHTHSHTLSYTPLMKPPANNIRVNRRVTCKILEAKGLSSGSGSSSTSMSCDGKRSLQLESTDPNPPSDTIHPLPLHPPHLLPIDPTTTIATMTMTMTMTTTPTITTSRATGFLRDPPSGQARGTDTGPPVE